MGSIFCLWYYTFLKHTYLYYITIYFFQTTFQINQIILKQNCLLEEAI